MMVLQVWDAIRKKNEVFSIHNILPSKDRAKAFPFCMSYYYFEWLSTANERGYFK